VSAPCVLPLSARLADRVGLSCLSLTGQGAWGPPVNRHAAIGIVRAAADAGAQLFDTSDAYGPGLSEELLAEALHPYRDEVVIATKAGFARRGPDDWTTDASPAALRRACDASLRRLRLEAIPLYQLHAPDPAVPLADSVGALDDLRREGKVGAIGVCNLSPEQVRAALAVAPLETVMVGMRDQRADLAELLRLCAEHGLTFLHWPRSVPGDPWSSAVAAIARRHDVGPATVMTAWLLASDPAFVPIPGARSRAQLQAQRRGLDLVLSPAETTCLDDRYLNAAPPGDETGALT
jgi:pyridoxine 4-dehydrogenase